MESKISLVLSRYRENIGWVYDYLDNPDIKVFVYNKGDIGIGLKSENITVVKRENVGRECETYLSHIVNNYDNLSDLTIFTQAFPFDNIPSFFDFLDYDVSLDQFEKYFNWYGTKVHECDQNGSPGIYPITSGHPNPHNRTVRTIYEDIFSDECPSEIVFRPNASFSVSKDLILKHPKEFYEKLIGYLNYPEQFDYEGQFKCNPYEAHVIERLWGIIFDEEV